MHLRLSNAPQLSISADKVLPLAPRDVAPLAWLALEGPTSRNRLAQLLWPDSEPLAARNALRQRLFQLRSIWRKPCNSPLRATLRGGSRSTVRPGFSGPPATRCRPSFATASCTATRSTARCSRWRVGSELDPEGPVDEDAGLRLRRRSA